MSNYPRPCSTCGTLTGRDGFARDRYKASGRKSQCKVCDRENAAAYYAVHREVKLARMEAKRREADTRARSLEGPRRYVPSWERERE